MSVEHKLVQNNGIYTFVTQYSYDSFNVAIGRKMKDGHLENKCLIKNLKQVVYWLFFWSQPTSVNII